jgi:hypothetical protein
MRPFFLFWQIFRKKLLLLQTGKKIGQIWPVKKKFPFG